MKKQIAILMIASVFLLAGITTAYYNTSSIGYDNANIISISNDEIKLFDIDINYKKIKNKMDKLQKELPEQYITI